MSSYRLRHPRSLALAGLLLLGLGGPAHAVCLNESFAVEVPDAGTKTTLPDGMRVISTAKTSAGVVEIRAAVKGGLITSTGVYVDSKAAQQTSFEKLPPEAQKCAKLVMGAAPEAPRALLAALDFLISPAHAGTCKAKLVFTAEHCVYNGGVKTCGYARVYEMCGRYYVV